MNELRIENDIASRKIVKKYLFPREWYEHDSGGILYAVMSPIELPYRISQILKDGFFHTIGEEHIHC